jgi:hypothetical protein
VIVLDHLRMKNTATRQRDIKWLGHFVNKPQVSGSLLHTAVPGKIETFNGTDYTASHGSGNLAIRTLLPDSSRITRIGGTGYEYWVNGVNYPPAVAADTGFYTPGSWRIEVSPSRITDSVIFLHTIQMGDTINRSMPGGSLLRSPNSVGTDWNDSLYFFSATADTGMVYHRFAQVNGNRTIGIFAADLRPGTYYVKVDAVTVSTVNTDINGILKTSAALPAGKHLIEITNSSSPAGNPVNRNNPLVVYPNPAQTELNIAAIPYLQKMEIAVFNSLGQLLLKTSNTNKLNISVLAGGVYIVKVVIDDQHHFAAKFIKAN